jgi:ABC-type nitrate/sulfonate/bicarbonate transport system substrate-binding protein
VAADHPEGEVRIGVGRYVGDSHIFIAREKGLFKKNGLNAKLVINRTGMENVQKLLRGEVDFAMILPLPIIFGTYDPKFFLRGPDPDPEFVIIANLMQSPSLNSVVVAVNSGVKTPKDLEGKKIALMAGTGSEYYWYSYAVYHGIDPTKVQIVDSKIEDIRGLIEAGHADAFTFWEPVSSNIRSQISIPLIELPEQKLYASGRLVLVRRAFAQKGMGSPIRERHGVKS